MPIVDEKVVYHLTGGDYIVSNRVRYYPYKVSYVDLYDYMKVPNGSALPVHTDIVRAQNAEDAKGMFRLKNAAPTLAFLSAGRHPERLGTSVIGSQYVTLNKKQLKALEKEVQSGAAKLPHPINPSVFVTRNPNSTVYTRPASPPTIKTYKRPTTSTGHPVSVASIGARPSVAKSTPIQLSSASLDVGGFSVGFRKPGDPVPATPPPPARPTPQPDIYNLANTAVPGGSLVSAAAVAPAPSTVAMPSGYYQFTTNDGVTHDAVAVPHVDNIQSRTPVEVKTPVEIKVPVEVKTPVEVKQELPRYAPLVDESVKVKFLDPKDDSTDDGFVSPVLEAAEKAEVPAPSNPFFYADESQTASVVPPPQPVAPPEPKLNWFFGLLGLGLVGIIHLVKPTKKS